MKKLTKFINIILVLSLLLVVSGCKEKEPFEVKYELVPQTKPFQAGLYTE